MSVGKYQRDPLTGKYQRDPATGKLLRFTADGQPCCCEGGPTCGSPGGCPGDSVLHDGVLYPPYWRVIISATSARLNECMRINTPATGGCPRDPVAGRTLRLTGASAMWNRTVYLCRQSVITPTGAGYACSDDQPSQAAPQPFRYDVFGQGSFCDDATLDEIINVRYAININSVSGSLFSRAGMSGDLGTFLNPTTNSVGMCLRWGVYECPFSSVPLFNAATQSFLDGDATYTVTSGAPPADPSFQTSLLNPLNRSVTFRVTSGSLLGGGPGVAMGGLGAPFPIPADWDPESERRRLLNGGCCGAPSAGWPTA